MRRNAPALLALGVVNLLIGTIFLAVNYASARAVMDNAYLLNSTLGPWCVLVGVNFLLGSLVGFGVPWWLAAPLIVARIGGEVYIYGTTAETHTAARAVSATTPYGGEPFINCAASWCSSLHESKVSSVFMGVHPALQNGIVGTGVARWRAYRC
jgi:hypothetical protein